MASKPREVASNLSRDAKRRGRAMRKVGGRLMDEKEEEAERRAKSLFSGETRMGRVAQEGTLMSILTLGIIGIIGVLIYSQVSESLPAPSDENLSNTSDDIDSGFADALGLLPVVLIVLMAALVIAVVQRFRG